MAIRVTRASQAAGSAASAIRVFIDCVRRQFAAIIACDSFTGLGTPPSGTGVTAYNNGARSGGIPMTVDLKSHRILVAAAVAGSVLAGPLAQAAAKNAAARDSDLRQAHRHPRGGGAREQVVVVAESRVPRGAAQGLRVEVEVLHAGRPRQGPGGRAGRARARRRRRDASGLEHRQGPDEGGRLRAGARHLQQERQFGRQRTSAGCWVAWSAASPAR